MFSLPAFYPGCPGVCTTVRRRFVPLILFGWLSFGLSGGAQAADLHVDSRATGAPTGMDWDHAYRDLQTALAAATPGDVILVAGDVGGLVYTPTASAARDLSFELVDRVRLEGGYAGVASSSPYDRDWDRYETILSGDIGIPSDPFDNSYQVIRAVGRGEGAVLEGFRIRGGRATGGSVDPIFDYGAGICVDGVSVAVHSCDFEVNFARAHGGAVAMFGSGNSPELYDCRFYLNSAEEWGGAIYNDISNKRNLPLVLNCFFGSNRSGSGGAVWTTMNADLLLLGSIFSRNEADYDGGAVYLEAGGGGAVEIGSCTFYRNVADHAGYGSGAGGGIFGGNGSTVVINSILWNNRDHRGVPTGDSQIDGSVGTVDYCCIQNWTRTGVIVTTHPLFVQPVGSDGVLGTFDDNFRLRRMSPCIDAGDNSRVNPEIVSLGTDVYANPRFDATSGVIDMGAAERL